MRGVSVAELKVLVTFFLRTRVHDFFTQELEAALALA